MVIYASSGRDEIYDYLLNVIFAVMEYFGFASPGSDKPMTNEWQMSTPYERDLNGKSVETGWMLKTGFLEIYPLL